MMAKFEPGKKNCGDPGSGRLLHELEVLSKALYLDKNPPNGMVSVSGGRSKSAGKTHASDIKPKTRFLKEDLSHKYMDSSQKDKKSLWGWKALKSLSHIRSRRFNCCFSLQVHSIEGLPPNFNGVSLCVRWKRKEGELQTRSARVLEGTAEFEEILTYCCPVYGSRNGPHHSAKYEAKHFLLYASVDGSPNLDLGKHRIDLTRLLPLTLEELEEEKSSGSKWTTSFKLSGKAKGAALNVSFGFLVIGDGRVESTGNRNAPQLLNLKQNRLSATKPVIDLDLWDSKGLHRRAGSLPSRSVEDAKILHEVLPTSRSELSTAVSLLYQKPDESKFSSLLDSRPKFKVSSEKVEPLKPHSDSPSECARGDCENLCEDPEFAVVEKGIEISEKEEVKLECSTEEAVGDSSVETIKVSDINKGDEMSPEEDSKTNPQDEAYGNYRKELLVNDFDSKENNICTKESVMEELEQAFHNLSLLESEVLDSPRTKCESPEQADYTEAKLNYKASKMGKSLSLDDATASVASEFLSMLGIDHSPCGLSSDSDPESPRERLLRQFEKDTLAGGNYIFDFDCGKESGFGYDALTGPGWGEFSEGFQSTSVVQDAESEHHWETKAMENKTRVKMLEDLETEALMREWGLNEKIFQSSPPDNSGGFGSPIHLLPEEPLELPPLAEGLGPFVQTKDGGFLRSMNPSLFKNAKNGGSLIMQVSSPVVVPAEMGSGIMEILQRLASVGIEKLSMQANKLMPLEDITGKTIHQVAWETAPCLEASERQVLLQHETMVGQDISGGRKKCKTRHRSNILNSSSLRGEIGSEYVSLEDLAPLAMDKIEALSIEGLRIQSGMSDEDAPSNISPQSIGEISALEGKRANTNGCLGLEGAAGLQLLDIKDCEDDVDGLMGLSITLDEWMRLDAGLVDDEDRISERTSKILAAHHAKCTDLITGAQNGDKRHSKGSGRRYGLLGNNFTVALMVQLRDPLRNYELVGAPMLALIQVERVFVPPKPRIYHMVSEERRNNEENDEPELLVKEEEIKDKASEKKDEEEGIPQFKITEVHVAGLKTEPDKKKLWGTKTQQQSGSRWLLASGMGKSKHPFMKSKAVSKSSPQMTTTVQPGDTLWSISSRVHGTGAKWKELAALNPHIRNPNIIFPNETIRLR